MAIRPARRLPAHCSVAVSVRSRNASRNVASESSSSRSTAPCTLQVPRGRVDLRHRAVPAHVERVGGGQRALGQRRQTGLGIERLALVHDQVRALSVAIHAPSLRSARIPRRGRPRDRHRRAVRLGRCPERGRELARGPVSDPAGRRRPGPGPGAGDPPRPARPRPRPARLPSAAAVLLGVLRGPARAAGGRAGHLPVGDRARAGDRGRGRRHRARADRAAVGDVVRARRHRRADRPRGGDGDHAPGRRAATDSQRAGGESLFNDATALVAYKVAVAAAVGESISAGHTVLEFFRDAGGGIVSR